MLQSYNPITAETVMVWAISTSLATTTEITIVFSSCAYLDVSVQRVRLLTDDWSSTRRVSPFRNARINSYLPIPVPYRSLSRLSSPLRAKASPVYPFLLSSTCTAFAQYGMLFRLAIWFLLSAWSCQLFPNSVTYCCLLLFYFFQYVKELLL